MASVKLIALIDARLRELGLSERQACLKAGLKVDAIRTIRRGHAPTLSKLRLLAVALDVPLDNLIEAASDLRFGEAPSTADALGSSARPLRGRARTFLDRLKAREPTAPPGYVYVARLVRQGGAGDTSEPAEATLVRERFIRTELRGDPGDFLAAEVEGPAMQPVLQSRDEILIDCRRRAPVQPGLFALDQGLGPVVRWVEFVPGSEPPRYRVRSETPLIEPYEVDADAAGIIGRVVWFGRRL